MVWLGCEMGEQARAMLTASLLRAAPLAIPVAGGDASVLGNDLVDAMCSRPFSSDHPLIMMYWSSMGPRDAVAQLYGSTWPPEERWAEWSRYTVIVAGAEPAELRAALWEGSDQRHG